MSLGYKRKWTAVPNFADPVQQDFATWVMNTLNELQGQVVAPIAPQVTTVSHPGAVLVAWNEQNQAVAYALYEMPTAAAPPGVPFATVPANRAAQANAYLRASLNDLVTRYYSVVTITQYGRSNPSTAVPGTALATGATIIPVSNKPLNQNSVGGGTGGGGGLPGTSQGPHY